MTSYISLICLKILYLSVKLSYVIAFLKPGALRLLEFKMSSKSLWSWINSAVTSTLGSSNPETFSWCNQIKAFATLRLAMVCTARETFMMFLLK